MDPELRPYAGVLFPQDLQLDDVILAIIAEAQAQTDGSLPFEQHTAELLQNTLTALNTQSQEIIQEQEAIAYFISHPAERRSVLDISAMASNVEFDREKPDVVQPLRIPLGPYTNGTKAAFAKLYSRCESALNRLKSEQKLSQELAWISDDTLPAKLQPFFASAAARAASNTIDELVRSFEDRYETKSTISIKLTPQSLRTDLSLAGASGGVVSAGGATLASMAYAASYLPTVAAYYPSLAMLSALPLVTTALVTLCAIGGGVLAGVWSIKEAVKKSISPVQTVQDLSLTVTNKRTGDVAFLEDVPRDYLVREVGEAAGIIGRISHRALGDVTVSVQHDPLDRAFVQTQYIAECDAHTSTKALQAIKTVARYATKKIEGMEADLVRIAVTSDKAKESRRQVYTRTILQDNAQFFGDLPTSARNAAAFAQIHADTINELLQQGELFEQSLQRVVYYATIAEWAASTKQNYDICFPTFNTEGTVLTDFIHPIVAARTPAGILNSYRDGDAAVTLVTGVNDNGKTTYVAAVAIAHAMAQAGLPVIASAAAITPKDQILTLTVKPSDIVLDSSRAVAEAGRIPLLFDRVTERSLVVLDEMLTSTEPEAACSVIQDYLLLLNAIQCKTMMTTHYHALIAFVDKQPGMRNLSAPLGTNGEHFYRIVPGGCYDTDIESVLRRHGAHPRDAAKQLFHRMQTGDLKPNANLGSLLKDYQ